MLSLHPVVSDFIQFQSNVADTKVKYVFHLIPKQSASALTKSLIDLVEYSRSAEVFMIVDDCLMIYNYIFFNGTPEQRLLVVKLVHNIILHLGKNLVDYTERIFPSLFLFSNDEVPQISKEATLVLDKFLSTPEKKANLIRKFSEQFFEQMNYLFELKTTDYSIMSHLYRTGIYTTIKFIEIIGITPEVKNLIENVKLSTRLIPISGNFQPYLSPSVRLSAYTLIKIAIQHGINIVSDNIILSCFKNEASSTNLAFLINVIANMDVSPEKLRPIILDSLHNFSDPQPLEPLLTPLLTQGFIDQCLINISKMANLQDSITLYSFFLKLPVQPSESLMKSFFDEALKGSTKFFKQIPLDPRFLESADLSTATEERAVEVIASCPSKAESWLKSRDTISTTALLSLSEEAFKIWPEIKMMPLQLDKKAPLFFANHAQKQDIEFICQRHRKEFIEMLGLWRRDPSILKNDSVKSSAKNILSQHLELASLFNQIFGDEISDVITDHVINAMNRGESIDPSLFADFKPSGNFYRNVLIAQVPFPQDHPLFHQLVDFISTHNDDIEIARPAAALVQNAQAPIDTITPTNPRFAMEYWDEFDFEGVNNIKIAHLLEELIRYEDPWIDIFIYQRKSITVDPILVRIIKERCEELPEVCLKEGLVVALSACVSSLPLKKINLPMDAVSMQVFKPVKQATSNKLSIVLQMEAGLIPVSPPLLGDELTIALRQSLAFIKKFPDGINDTILQYATIGLSSSRFDCYLSLLILHKARSTEQMPILIKKLPDLLPLSQAAEMAISDYILDYGNTSIFLDFVPYSNYPHISNSLVDLLRRNGEWDILKKIENVEEWSLVMEAMPKMPQTKRVAFVEEFSEKVMAALPSVDIHSQTFIRLAYSFPSAVFKWSTTIGSAQYQAAEAELTKNSLFIFNKIKASLQEVFLKGTSCKVNTDTRTIRVVTQQTMDSEELVMEIHIPSRFPLKHIQPHCLIKDNSIAEESERKVLGTMMSTQSLALAIGAWYTAIDGKYGDVCPVCYAFYNDGEVPSASCPVCHHKFHKRCLAKWFASTIIPSCPYCASPFKKQK